MIMVLLYFIYFAYFIIIIAIVCADGRQHQAKKNQWLLLCVCVCVYRLAQIAWDIIKSNGKKWEQQPTMTKVKNSKI